MASKFSKGKIYKIVSNNPDITEVYYGSTIQTLSMRMAGHRSDYKRWIDGETKSISIFPYFTQYKIEQFHIELVEDYACENKNQLCARENYYIRNFDCVNKNSAPLGLTTKEYNIQYRQEHKEHIAQYKQEYYQEHKEQIVQYRQEYYQEHKEEKQEYDIQYRQENKEQIAQYKQEYYQENKEQIKELAKQYYQENKEERKEASKQYRQEHKEEISQKNKVKISCGCGCEITKSSLYMHTKSKKHVAWLSTQAILQPGDIVQYDI